MKKNARNTSSDDVFQILNERRDILAKYRVRRVGVFGSFARKEQLPGSDVDLVVEFEYPSLDNFMGLTSSLERLFGRKVDILTPAGVESIRIKEVADEIKRTVVYV